MESRKEWRDIMEREVPEQLQRQNLWVELLGQGQDDKFD